MPPNGFNPFDLVDDLKKNRIPTKTGRVFGESVDWSGIP